MSGSNTPAERAAWVDYASAALIGAATVLGALSAFFGSQWGGVMTADAQKALFLLSKSNTVFLGALNEKSSFDFTDFKDDYLYLEWTKAFEAKRLVEADYLVSKMSAGQAEAIHSAKSENELVAAYEKYLAETAAQHQKIDAAIAASVADAGTSAQLMKSSETANNNGDRFSLTVVFFTIVLFFGGMAALVKRNTIAMAYLGLATVVFVYAVATMFLIPWPV